VRSLFFQNHPHAIPHGRLPVTTPRILSHLSKKFRRSGTQELRNHLLPLSADGEDLLIRRRLGTKYRYVGAHLSRTRKDEPNLEKRLRLPPDRTSQPAIRGQDQMPQRLCK